MTETLALVERLLDKYGLPLIILAVIAVAVWKGVWPLVKDRIAKADAEREKVLAQNETQRATFLVQLSQRDSDTLSALNGFTNAIKSLGDEVKRSNDEHLRAMGNIAESLKRIEANTGGKKHDA